MHSKGCHFDWSEAKWRNLVEWDFSTSFHCARNDKILGIDNLYPKFRCFAIRIGKIDQKKQEPRLRNQDKMLNFEWFFTVQQLLNFQTFYWNQTSRYNNFWTLTIEFQRLSFRLKRSEMEKSSWLRFLDFISLRSKWQNLRNW